jgi:aryl-alcohol dehydrogenase-like predicted oxidoreductase
MKKDKILLPLDPSNARTPWLWIGTWSMGGEGFGSHDERESLRVLSTAVKNNIRHFDTAGFYAHGKSEMLLQEIIKTDRPEFFISSKGGLIWEGREVKHSASPEGLKKQLFETLDRLKTDYLDLYQLHWPDTEVPLRESISALRTFQKQGLIRFWGVGNLTEQQIIDNLMGEKNIPHQVHFNPLRRNHNILSAGQVRCINCIISPLEQGLLGRGKSSSGTLGIGKKDVRRRNPCFADSEVLKWTCRLDELLKQHSISKVSSVLMWICSRPHVHAIIPGPRKMEQLDELLAFKAEVETNDLFSIREDTGILSDEKVRKMVPHEIWQHLDKGTDTAR